MQSHDYVPGVSGWKIDPTTGAFELCSNQVTVSGFDPRATYSSKPMDEANEPYIIEGGKMYINGAALDKLVKEATTDRIKIKISTPSITDEVRDVLRDELKPGGMLYRS